MTAERKPLVLELFSEGDVLNMSVFEPLDFASTLRRFSQVKIKFDHIQKVCDDIVSVLSKPRKAFVEDEGPLNNLKRSGELLWDQILGASVKNKLKSAASCDLLLLIDEELVTIPWELLFDGDDFLCLKFNIGRLLRARDRGLQPSYRQINPKLKMLILADPTGDLRSAYEEGLSIRNTFDNRRHKLGIDLKTTSIDSMFVKKNLGDYDIVHYAGHCECDRKDPENSGWVLRDGMFTSREIITMGETFTMPSLVFSNGCQSAQTPKKILSRDYQKKTYGLASAFLFAGVRHYIGAAWRIQDAVSFVFAKEFYSALRRGCSVGESVRLARVKLARSYGLRNFYWASYLLYGAPGFVLFRKPQKPAAAVLYKQRLAGIMRHKKILIGSGSLAVAAALAVLLYNWLPSINPNSYFLLRSASKKLSAGLNSAALADSEAVILKEPNMISAYPLMAEANARMGKRDAAIQNYFDYALSAGRRGDHRAVAASYCMIGWLYQQQGKYAKAYDFYRKSLAESGARKDKLNEAIAIRKLAVWHMDKEENDRALELLTKSSEINNERQRDPAHRYNLACDYFDLGLLFSNKEDMPAAKEFYLKSLKLFEKMKKKQEYSDYYFNLGEISLLEKDHLKALEYYNLGLDMDKAANNIPSIAQDYNMIGELYVDMDDSLKAEEYFKKSLELCDPENMAPEIAAVSYNLGLLYKARGHKRKAQDYLRKAEEIYAGADYPGYEELKNELLALW